MAKQGQYRSVASELRFMVPFKNWRVRQKPPTTRFSSLRSTASFGRAFLLAVSKATTAQEITSIFLQSTHVYFQTTRSVRTFFQLLHHTKQLLLLPHVVCICGERGLLYVAHQFRESFGPVEDSLPHYHFHCLPPASAAFVQPRTPQPQRRMVKRKTKRTCLTGNENLF